MSVMDMVQTDRCSYIYECWSPTGQRGCKDFEKLTNLVLTSNAVPGRLSRESEQGIVKTCLEMSAVDLTEVYSPAIFNERSMQLGISKGVAAELETSWNLDTTKTRRDKCSIELRTAKQKILIANPLVPINLEVTQ